MAPACCPSIMGHIIHLPSSKLRSSWRMTPQRWGGLSIRATARSSAMHRKWRRSPSSSGCRRWMRNRWCTWAGCRESLAAQFLKRGGSS